MGELSRLKGLGPKSELWLNEVGIHAREQLQERGAVRAFIKLRNECATKPSLNFLYAMVGALEDKYWTDFARQEKGRLLMDLEGYAELEAILRSDGLGIDV